VNLAAIEAPPMHARPIAAGASSNNKSTSMSIALLLVAVRGLAAQRTTMRAR
jgi:hypothetical protein